MSDYQTIPSQKIFTVSELTSKIKGLLEEKFSFIWISGEISNFKIPSSGHYYFSLKDDAAQIQCVMFRGQNRKLKFLPEDGMQVTGFGRIGVYAPRGSYQVIFEYLEPSGYGALQAAFEQLKKKLEAEGLFDEARKRPIPFLPKRILIITSPTGAVVHDIIRVLHRRFENIAISILPVKVQGDEAASLITEAFALANELPDIDLVILARGGGSIEDLAPFNSESVARAIAGSRVPVISAVGHETDFTIADFVADLRAPTPSAAAELAVAVKTELVYTLSSLKCRMYKGLKKLIENRKMLVEGLKKRLRHPARRINDLRLKTDDLCFRMNGAMQRRITSERQRLEMNEKRLFALSPEKRVQDARVHLSDTSRRLFRATSVLVNGKRLAFLRISEHLRALDPEAILARGYSITHSLPHRSIVRDASTVIPGQKLEIVLGRGRLVVLTKKTENDRKRSLKEQ